MEKILNLTLTHIPNNGICLNKIHNLYVHDNTTPLAQFFMFPLHTNYNFSFNLLVIIYFDNLQMNLHWIKL